MCPVSELHLISYTDSVHGLTPDQLHRGIGQELTRRMLERLGHLYMIDLLCDPELQPFYAKVGMRLAAGMFVRNFDRQSGV